MCGAFLVQTSASETAWMGRLGCLCSPGTKGCPPLPITTKLLLAAHQQPPLYKLHACNQSSFFRELVHLWACSCVPSFTGPPVCLVECESTKTGSCPPGAHSHVPHTDQPSESFGKCDLGQTTVSNDVKLSTPLGPSFFQQASEGGSGAQMESNRKFPGAAWSAHQKMFWVCCKGSRGHPNNSPCPTSCPALHAGLLECLSLTPAATFLTCHPCDHCGYHLITSVAHPPGQQGTHPVRSLTPDASLDPRTSATPLVALGPVPSPLLRLLKS